MSECSRSRAVLETSKFSETQIVEMLKDAEGEFCPWTGPWDHGFRYHPRGSNRPIF